MPDKRRGVILRQTNDVNYEIHVRSHEGVHASHAYTLESAIEFTKDVFRSRRVTEVNIYLDGKLLASYTAD